MREKLNLRGWAVVGGVAAVVGCAWFVTHRVQARRTAPLLRVSSDAAKERNRPDRAAQFLAAYLRRHPEANDVRVEYAELQLKLADSPAGRKQLLGVLEEIVRRDPDNDEMRRRLVPIALEAGDLPLAEKSLLALIKQQPDDQDDLEEQLADCLAGQGKPTAEEAYRLLIEKRPARVTAYAKLAHLLRTGLSQPVLADECMDELVKANPESPDAYLGRARYYLNLNRPKPAAADVAACLRLAPTRPEAVFLAAELAERTADGRKAARGRLEALLAADPKQPGAYEWLALLDAEDQKVAAAVGWLERGLTAVPGDVNLTWNLAHLKVQQGQLDEAERLKAKLPQEQATGRVPFLEAAVAARRGQLQAAADLLEKVDRQPAVSRPLKTQAHLLLGDCYEKLGNPGKSLDAYTKAVDADPASAAGRLGCVSAHLLAGDLTNALRECEALVKLPEPSPLARLTHARLMVLRMLTVAPAQQKWADVEAQLGRLSEALPGSAEVVVLQAEVLLAKGQRDEARALLTDARRVAPKEEVLAVALVDLLSRAGLAAEAAAVLAEGDKVLADSADWRLARGRALARANGTSATTEIVKLADSASGFGPADQAKLYRGVAQLLGEAGDLPRAAAMWAKVTGVLPSDLEAWLMVFDLATLRKDWDAMAAARKAVVKTEGGPSGPLGRFTLAATAVAKAQDGQAADLNLARRLLGLVQQDRPRWPRVPLAVAEIDLLEQSPAAAIDQYKQAIDLGDRQPAVFYRLVGLLYERRRYKDADDVLRKLPRRVPVGVSLQRLAAEVSLEVNDHPRAEDFARKAVPVASKNPADHRWLGHVLGATGKADEAEQALREAVRLGPADAQNHVLLVQLLARANQPAKAEAALKDAEAKLGPGSELGLAECYAALDRHDRARELYAAARKAKPGDPVVLQECAKVHIQQGEFKAAEECLRARLAVVKADDRDVAQTRALLAVILASQGERKLGQEALTMLGLEDPKTTAVPAGLSAEEVRARTVVLATQPGRARAVQALAVLEALEERPELRGEFKPEDRFLRAQLSERVGDFAKVRQDMQALLTADGDNVRYLTHQIRYLLRRKYYNDAGRWLEALERVAPNALPPVELRLRLLMGRRQDAEARDLARARLDPKDVPNLLAVGALLEDVGLAGEAEPYYRRFAADTKNPPVRRLTLARYLARVGKAEEALTLCRAADPACPPEAVGTALVAVARDGKLGDADLRAVRQDVVGLLAQAPRSGDLRVCLAELEDLAGRYDATRTMYREVLQAEPGNVEALNNLAWLLAFEDGKGAEAVELATAAIAAFGPIAELQDTLGLALLAAGKPAEAVKVLEEADSPLVAAKTRAAIKLHLAVASARLKQADDAERYLKEAKDAGLKRVGLHPLEQELWDEVAKATKP